MGAKAGTIEKLVRSKQLKESPRARSGSGESVDAKVYARRVEKKAYELYRKRGGQDGHDCDDWLEAERIVEQEMILGQ